jgi:glyoxylase-like metal-dependent hydrolase (beta-lactamase superfamily II)
VDDEIDSDPTAQQGEPMTTITTRTAARDGVHNESRTRFTRNVAPGVHRLQHAYVNCYIVEESGGLTIVDAALPGTWPYLERALELIGRGPADIVAVVLTHAHFDHLGFARRLQEEWGTPVYAHPAESYIAEHPYRYAHENNRFLYPLRHPGSIPVLTRMAKAGALRVPGITGLTFFEPGQTLDVPGHPLAVFTPGHTFGHCGLLFADRGALLTGDALVTLDPYTGVAGPQIVSGAATADSAAALLSLAEFERADVAVLLPGHGQPWHGGAGDAVARARAAGPS